VNDLFLVQIFQTLGNLQRDCPYLSSPDGRWLIFDEKRWDRATGLFAVNVVCQIQIAQFHVNEHVMSILHFSYSQNIHDMRMWSSPAEVSQVIDFILDHFRFNERFVN